MKIDLRKKVSGLQEEFKKEFGIGIRVYKGSKFAPDVALKELIEPGTKGGDIEFGGNTKVKTVEQAFLDNYGIKIQVESKDGKLADNDATLASLLKK
ncbi:MAG: hypothetical protein KBF93_25850 [Leptospiraceae bacterium]|jgi:hypothetical protein|nr:hypothetical protein [Leptospiraceae bacterium]